MVLVSLPNNLLRQPAARLRLHTACSEPLRISLCPGQPDAEVEEDPVDSILVDHVKRCGDHGCATAIGSAAEAADARTRSISRSGAVCYTPLDEVCSHETGTQQQDFLGIHAGRLGTHRGPIGRVAMLLCSAALGWRATLAPSRPFSLRRSALPPLMVLGDTDSVAAKRALVLETARSAFLFADTDGSGVLDREEVTTLMQRIMSANATSSGNDVDDSAAPSASAGLMALSSAAPRLAC